jgi:hypothetical protein
MTINRYYKHLGWKRLCLILIFLVIVIFLLIFRLGSLTHGVSASEATTSVRVIGWHGIYNAPFNLPLKFIRSLDFYLFKHHGQTLTRLPNAIFGFLSIISFTYLIYLWHGKRTALLAGALFATSAWVLHVSRFASSDVMYLWGIVSLMLINGLIQKRNFGKKSWAFCCLIIGLLFTIPGFIWLLLAEAFLQRSVIWGVIEEQSLVYKLLGLFLSVLWLPLMIYNLTRPSQIRLWLGLPKHLPGLAKLIKQFAAVPYHLLVRGPKYPSLWLGRSPLVDVFTLAAALAGIYFYAQHYNSRRSKTLAGLFVLSWILVSLGGLVSFSLVVVFLYLFAATGITYLLHSWLNVFPANPLARSLGIALISLAVTFSCLYNLRSYFVAWPNDPATKATFSRHI